MIKARQIKLMESLASFLPMLFWVLIIFSFEEGLTAFITLISIVIHESGHLLYLLLKKKSFRLRAKANGLRIRTVNYSYCDEIITYASGPISNIIASVAFVLLSIPFGEFFSTLAIMNLMTAVSNLLPIRGYDGYGMIYTILKKTEAKPLSIRLLDGISSVTIFCFCIISLYLMDRYNGGYWIFFVFFILLVKDMDRSFNK